MADSKAGSAYRAAGVDIESQDRALAKVKDMVKQTFTPGVLSEIGTFGGLFKPPIEGLSEPVLVASADGVGTKLVVAKMAGDLSTVGRDLVNHCVNDILVQGARPLFFLDYLAAGQLEPEKVVELVTGLTAACRENGCALLGGETAEMPGFYSPGDYELVGFVVGMVDRPNLFDGSRVRPGDILLGLPSSGLHTNGYSLVRHIVFDRLRLGLADPMPGVNGSKTIGQLLLEPHRSYLSALTPLLRHPALHAMAHITGGGLTDNVPRVLPRNTQALIRIGSWKIPELFLALQKFGEVEIEEMLRVFNMGIGMVLVVAPDGLSDIIAELAKGGHSALPIGTVQGGDDGVAYDFEGTGAEAGVVGGT